MRPHRARRVVFEPPRARASARCPPSTARAFGAWAWAATGGSRRHISSPSSVASGQRRRRACAPSRASRDSAPRSRGGLPPAIRACKNARKLSTVAGSFGVPSPYRTRRTPASLRASGAGIGGIGQVQVVREGSQALDEGLGTRGRDLGDRRVAPVGARGMSSMAQSLSVRHKIRQRIMSARRNPTCVKCRMRQH
jgi:hypothetical protein